MFNGVTSTEVSHVVNISGNIDWRLARDRGTEEEARGMWAGMEAHGCKRAFHEVVPVPRRTSKAIESFAKTPVGVWWRDGATMGRGDNNYLLRRENGLTEGILGVCLFKVSAIVYGHGQKETDRGLSDNGGKTITFGPRGLFQISKDNDTTLCARGNTVNTFDDLDTHGRDGFSAFGAKGFVL